VDVVLDVDVRGQGMVFCEQMNAVDEHIGYNGILWVDENELGVLFVWPVVLIC